MRIAAIGLLLAALALPVAAHADTACKFTIESAVTELASADLPFYVVDSPEAIAEAVAALNEAGAGVTGNVTRILIAVSNGQYIYGLEIDGCLTPPQPVPSSLVSTSGLSGRYAFGTFA